VLAELSAYDPRWLVTLLLYTANCSFTRATRIRARKLSRAIGACVTKNESGRDRRPDSGFLVGARLDKRRLGGMCASYICSMIRRYHLLTNLLSNDRVA
jgi:hypothetical protein